MQQTSMTETLECSVAPAISGAILDLCLRKTRIRKLRDYRDVIVFGKTPFSKCFLSTLHRKASVFKFLLFVERLRKAPFFNSVVKLSRFMWTAGLTLKLKLCFQIFPLFKFVELLILRRVIICDTDQCAL